MMKIRRYKYISTILLLILLTSCAGYNNLDRPIFPDNEDGSFYKTKDGIEIFVYRKSPSKNCDTSIYIISGITGINHKTESDIIQLLGNEKNQVVVIHPRGTGYSAGVRGDINNFENFTDDYIEIITNDLKNLPANHKIILFGHSMSSAITLKVAESLKKTDGVILVNPPYKLESAKGMSPKISDYLKYAGYMIFAPHTPIVNMAGDPSLIENPEDRKESEERNNDILLIKYFSIYYMMESKKIMDNMVNYAANADYPLLLIYGNEDSIIEKAGCDDIYNNWKSNNKMYEIVEGGPHGKKTVELSIDVIHEWISRI